MLKVFARKSFAIVLTAALVVLSAVSCFFIKPVSRNAQAANIIGGNRQVLFYEGGIVNQYVADQLLEVARLATKSTLNDGSKNEYQAANGSSIRTANDGSGASYVEPIYLFNRLQPGQTTPEAVAMSNIPWTLTYISYPNGGASGEPIFTFYMDAPYRNSPFGRDATETTYNGTVLSDKNVLGTKGSKIRNNLTNDFNNLLKVYGYAQKYIVPPSAVYGLWQTEGGTKDNSWLAGEDGNMLNGDRINDLVWLPSAVDIGRVRDIKFPGVPQDLQDMFGLNSDNIYRPQEENRWGMEGDKAFTPATGISDNAWLRTTHYTYTIPDPDGSFDIPWPESTFQGISYVSKDGNVGEEMTEGRLYQGHPNVLAEFGVRPAIHLRVSDLSITPKWYSGVANKVDEIRTQINVANNNADDQLLQLDRAWQKIIEMKDAYFVDTGEVVQGVYDMPDLYIHEFIVPPAAELDVFKNEIRELLFGEGFPPSLSYLDVNDKILSLMSELMVLVDNIEANPPVNNLLIFIVIAAGAAALVVGLLFAIVSSVKAKKKRKRIRQEILMKRAAESQAQQQTPPYPAQPAAPSPSAVFP